MRLRLALVPAMLWISAAQAALSPSNEQDTARYIMPGCRAFLDHNTPDKGMALLEGVCLGQVRAAVLGLAARDPNLFCGPSDTPFNEVVRVVVDYIQEQPSRLDETFAFLSEEALLLRWPCHARQDR
jgi:hypothetical protein